jgi:hypothetical protein
MDDDPRNVQQYQEEKKHHAKHGCGWSREHFHKHAHGSGDKRHPDKVGPKQTPRHKGRHQCCHEAAVHEMLNAENHQGDGHEDSSQRLTFLHNGGACFRFYSATTTAKILQEMGRRVESNHACVLYGWI